MAYVLNGTTIPDPRGLHKTEIEKSVTHDMVNGASKKDISNRKNRWTMAYTRLSQANVALILSIRELRQAVTFSVDDGEMQIAETNVHVDITDHNYNTKGSEYREDFVLVLTEVE